MVAPVGPVSETDWLAMLSMRQSLIISPSDRTNGFPPAGAKIAKC
jgi:hypothetical protein